MFRSALFSLITLALLVGGFMLYLHYQPAAPPSALSPTTQAPTTGVSNQTQMKIGPGERAWANSYDDQGKLVSQFTAAEYLPQKDGSFKVVLPISKLYLNDDQYMKITADTGTVYAGSGQSAQMQSPNNGFLQKVRISLFPNQAATKPTLWLDMNNAWFDNDTLRLYTQSYQDENGKTISADQVPVTIRGDDYEFDGTGLTLRWDDRNRRLQLLEIAHGKRLEIKNPSKVSPGFVMPASASAMYPDALVDAAPDAAHLLMPTSNPTQPPYRAVFHDGIRINQGDKSVAMADQMMIDFLLNQSKPAPTSPPVVVPSATPTPPSPANSPSTAPAPVPITIYWTGKLRITPLDAPPILPISPSQAVVRLIGSPVLLTPENSEVRAASAVYRTGDGAARLDNSPSFPTIEFKQTNGMDFTADSLAYDPATSLATISGRSVLHMPLENHEQLTATWTDRGILHIIAKPQQTVDRVDLLGHVAVDHPQLTLHASELGLDLEPLAANHAGDRASVTLKQLTATGSVACRMLKTEQGNSGIDADHLIVQTSLGADSKPIPHLLFADGHVRAFEPDQELKSDHLEATMIPKKTDPNAMDLQSLKATSNVHAQLKNGATADANELQMTTVADGQQNIELRGTAKKQVSVFDGKGNSLSGPLILIDPKKSIASVQGAGSAHAAYKPDPNAAPQPVDMTWTDDLIANAAANTIDIHGHVTVESTDTTGTTSSISGDKAHVDLMDAPADHPPTDHEPTDHSPTDQSLGMDFSNKQLKALSLDGKIDGRSLLNFPNHTIARRGQLLGPSLSYDAQAGTARLPGPGKMLFEDYQPTSANRGAMAMQWSDSLTYSDSEKKIIVTGGVVVGFQPDKDVNKDAAPMRLSTDRLVVDVEPVSTDHPTTQPTKVQLTHLTAEGAVHFAAKSMQFDASKVEYDPKTDLLIASGTDRQPAQLYDEQGLSKGTFDELTYNAKTQEVEKTKGAKARAGR